MSEAQDLNRCLFPNCILLLYTYACIACIKGFLFSLAPAHLSYFPCCFHCFAIVTTVHYYFFYALSSSTSRTGKHPGLIWSHYPWKERRHLTFRISKCHPHCPVHMWIGVINLNFSKDLRIFLLDRCSVEKDFCWFIQFAFILSSSLTLCKLLPTMRQVCPWLLKKWIGVAAVFTYSSELGCFLLHYDIICSRLIKPQDSGGGGPWHLNENPKNNTDVFMSFAVSLLSRIQAENYLQPKKNIITVVKEGGDR